MPNPVAHWEIAVKDAEQARKFYSALFEWNIDFNNPLNYGMTNTGGLNGGIFKPPVGAPNYVTFYVQVDDIDASLKKAGELGGKVVVPNTPIPGVGAFGMFADSEGNVVGVFKGQS